MYCLRMVKRCICYILGILRRFLFDNRHRTYTPEHIRYSIRYRNDLPYHRLETTDSDDDDDDETLR